MFLLSMSLVAHVIVLPFHKMSYNLLEGLALLGELAFCFGIMTRVGVGSTTRNENSSSLLPGEQVAFDGISLAIASPFLFFWTVAFVDVLFNRGKLDFALRAQFPAIFEPLHQRRDGGVGGGGGGKALLLPPRQPSQQLAPLARGPGSARDAVA